MTMIKKRDATLEKHFGFPDWLNSQPFILIDWEPWSKKRSNYLGCIEGKLDGKEIHSSAQNAALFVDLLKRTILMWIQKCHFAPFFLKERERRRKRIIVSYHWQKVPSQRKHYRLHFWKSLPFIIKKNNKLFNS